MMIVICIIFLVVLKIYISVKHPFWNRQPIFHIYNIYYWFLKRGIIYNSLPPTDRKYYDTTISHYTFNNLTSNHKKIILKFIKDNWFNVKNKNFKPYIENFKYISMLKTDCMKGIICGEELSMGNNKVLYVDYLCVSKQFREKNISPKLIYNFFLKHHGEFKIFLFKWENKNMNIVPMCVYNVHHYKNIKFNINREFNPLKLVTITKEHLHLINKSDINKNFKITIYSNYNTFVTQIENNYIKVYALMKDNSVLGLYFFHRYNERSYNCYASINFDTKENFIYGIKTIINSLDKTMLLSIDDTSHSNILIESLHKEVKPYVTETHSYYFYNYINFPENSNDVLIIN